MDPPRDDTETVTHRLVLPRDANHYGTLYAGVLLSLALEAAYATAYRAAGLNANLVLKRVLDLRCFTPVPIGRVVEIRGREVHRARAQIIVALHGTPLNADRPTSPWMDGAMQFVQVDATGRPQPLAGEPALETPPHLPHPWLALRERALKLRSMRLKATSSLSDSEKKSVTSSPSSQYLGEGSSKGRRGQAMASGTIGALGRQLERLFTTGVIAGLTEDQLLDRFITGRDEAAFAALVSRHGPMVLGVCRQLLRDPNDVDDAFQATFLILVRKAGSLRRRDLLGNWLYGVAYRVAIRSRAIAARRAAGEINARDIESLTSSGKPPALLPELHEELNRLPESYRVAVVLCFLEGLTHDEAAQRLGWPIGTVKGRLARARELLRTRLTRRGLTPAVGAIAIESLTREAKAAIPASLLEHTLKAASLVAAGRLTAAGIISAQVVVLTEGVIHAMSFAKLKSLVVAMALAGSVLTGAGVLAYQGTGEGGTDDALSRRQTRAESKPAEAASSDRPAGKPDIAPISYNVFSNQSVTHQQLFDQFLANVRDWDTRKVDRLFHWSRAMKEAEEYLIQSDPELEKLEKTQGVRKSALTAHRDRMKRLYQLTQGLTAPNQAELADTAHRDLEDAQRELDATGQKTVTVVTQDGQFHIVGPESLVVEGEGPKVGKPARVPAPLVVRPVPLPEANRVKSDQRIATVVRDAADPLARSREYQARMNIAALSPLIVGEDKSPGTKTILTRLEEPVSMSFANETPFEDVLKYIKSAVQGRKEDDPGLPIYVDPVGLKEVGTTLQTPVALDLDGVPLKTTLRLLLKQLGLAYCVKDGVLMISSTEGINQELLEAATPEQKAKAGVVGRFVQ